MCVSLRSNITFVNFRGERHKFSAFVGESLLECAARHDYGYIPNACQGGSSDAENDHPEGKWVEPKYGQGAQCYHCHVVVGKEHAHTLPRMKWDEQEELDKYPLREDITETCVLGRLCCAGTVRPRPFPLTRAHVSPRRSRLSCQVSVTKEMEGMLVYVPDGPPVCDI